MVPAVRAICDYVCSNNGRTLLEQPAIRAAMIRMIERKSRVLPGVFDHYAQWIRTNFPEPSTSQQHAV